MRRGNGEEGRGKESGECDVGGGRGGGRRRVGSIKLEGTALGKSPWMKREGRRKRKGNGENTEGSWRNGEKEGEKER